MENKIESTLALENNVLFAYLFGSYADGTFTDRSDVDIAVFFEDTSFDLRLELHHTLEKKLKKKVDLVCLNDVKNIYLLEAILSKGVVVKEHELRKEYEYKKEHMIIDFKNFKKYIDAA